MNVRDALCTRDLRRIRIALEWNYTTGGGAASLLSLSPQYINSYQAARLLLLGQMSPLTWSQAAEDKDVSILAENMGVMGLGSLEKVSLYADHLSDYDVCRPSRFECRHALMHSSLFRLASATSLLVSPGSSVGALSPPMFLSTKTKREDVEEKTAVSVLKSFVR